MEIRAREDMMTYGLGGAGTLTRTAPRGGFNGIPMADPRLCTPSHGRSQYYMNTLERNANAAAAAPYYQDADQQQQPQSVHMMNYMNDLDAAMTRPIAYPHEEDGVPVAHGYYPEPHLMAMMMNGVGGGNGSDVDGDMLDQDPYNHTQNFEHVMHRKESHDRRVEDELWQGAGGMSQEQFFVSQSQLAGPEFRRGDTMGTHGRTRRKKANGGLGGSHYQIGSGMGSAASSSYNVHGEAQVGGNPHAHHHHHHHHQRGDEPIYEEIPSSMSGSGSIRQNPGSRHLSAFLNEKSNSVVSCLEPIK